MVYVVMTERNGYKNVLQGFKSYTSKEVVQRVADEYNVCSPDTKTDYAYVVALLVIEC